MSCAKPEGRRPGRILSILKRAGRLERACEATDAWCEQLEPRVLLSTSIELAASLTTTGSDAPIYAPVPDADTSDDTSLGDRIELLTNTSGPLIGLDTFNGDARFSAVDGSGYAAVILDTGIDRNHPFFGSDADSDGISDRIVYSYDFANGDANATDYNGHGSNVSSIVGSSDATYTGMAPGVDIIHLKVFTDAGGGNFAYTEAALQWVVANVDTYNIVSVNMSLGDTKNHNSAKLLYGINDELAALAAQDVIVVSAAGNSFADFGSAKGVAYPAADPNSLAIGAVYDSSVGSFSYGSGATAYSTGADRITPFSQRHGTLIDTFAPGAPSSGANYNGGVVAMHGTSQASPHVAGIAVLMQQYAEQMMGRRLTLSEFRTLLDSSGTTIVDGDDENDNVVNTGLSFKRIDVFSMADAIYNMAPPGPEIKVEYDGSNLVDGSSTADMGSVIVGATVEAQFTVTNLGTTNPMTLGSSITVPTGWSVVTGLGTTTVGTQSSTTFTLGFTPGSAGAHSGEVSLTSDDADEGTFNFTVSGIGATSVVGNDSGADFATTAGWTAHSTGIHFAAAGTGSSVATWSFDVSAGVYRVSASWAESASRATDSPFTVYDGSTALGTTTVNQRLAANDRTGSGTSFEDLGSSFNVTGTTLNVELSDDANGYVIADKIRIERLGDIPNEPEIGLLDGTTELASGSSAVDFGSTLSGVAVAKTFTIKNTGIQTLNLGTISLPTGFSVSQALGSSTLAPGGSTTFAAEYDGVADASGAITVVSDDTDENPFSFNVTGTSVSTLSLDDGSSYFGATAGFISHSSGIHYALAGSGSNTATWTLTVDPGLYRVSASWAASSSRASNAQYTLLDDAASEGTVSVSQRIAADDRKVGGVWYEDLSGAVDISSGTLKIQLSDNANGLVIADRILVTKIGDDRILDDGEAAFTAGGFTAHSSGIHYAVAGNGSNEASWTFTGLSAGTYRVSASWAAGSSRATNAGFTVLDNSTSVGTVTVNQRNAPNDRTDSGTAFEDLGASFEISSGTLVVKLSDGANGLVIADKIRIENVGDLRIVDDSESGFSSTGTFTSHSSGIHYAVAGSGSSVGTWGFTGLTAGTYRVSASWSASNSRATNATYTVKDGGSSVGSSSMNQRLAANDRTDGSTSFEDVGLFAITGTGMTVELSDNANGVVIADKVRIERLSDNRVYENGGASFSATSGFIYHSASGTHYAAAGSGTNTATWSFAGLSAGSYRVSASWTASASRATNATFSFLDGSTLLSSASVNQRLAADDRSDSGKWFEDLGTITLTGDTLNVELSDNANGYVIADAIKIEKL